MTESPSPLNEAVIPPSVLEVLRGLLRANHHAFLVGGCVRDMLRGERPKDFDLATSARPQQVQGLFKRVLPTGIQHGTVTVVLGGAHVEVTTFRAEAEYVDGRRPSKVEFHTDIEADLSRRDFTINAMAYDPVSKKLVDPFDGQSDLRSKTIRCVRSAEERFLEDGLRAMRAVRFATVLGFSIDRATEEAIPKTLHVFQKVATERINQEFTKLLLAPAASMGFSLTKRTGLLNGFLPEASGADGSCLGRAPPELEVRLAVLLSDAKSVKDVLLRLKYPVKVAVETAHAVEHQTLPEPNASDADLRRWLAKVSAAAAPRILALAVALGRETAVVPRIEAQLAAQPPLTAKALALNGKDLMNLLGVGPGPEIGEASQFLLNRVLEEPAANTREALTSVLKNEWKRSPQPPVSPA